MVFFYSLPPLSVSLFIISYRNHGISPNQLSTSPPFKSTPTGQASGMLTLSKMNERRVIIEQPVLKVTTKRKATNSWSKNSKPHDSQKHDIHHLGRHGND